MTRSWRVVVDAVVAESIDSQETEQLIAVVHAATAQEALRQLTSTSTNNARIVRIHVELSE